MSDIIKNLNFLTDNIRYQAVFILLLRSDAYLTSKELSDELLVTPRTIKSDIKYIRSQLSKSGLEIKSVPSKGYLLIIEDKNIENELKTHFRILNPGSLSDEFNNRVYYITKRLLTANEYVTTFDIQEELHISFSNKISRAIKEVKELLSEYQLKLESKPHYGMRITGEPYRKVMLLVRLYRFFDKTKVDNISPKSYNKLFEFSKESENFLRQIVIEELRVSDVVLSDIYVERLIVYLIYFINNEFDSQLDNQNLDKYEYTKSREYRLITNIVKSLNYPNLNKEISIKFLTYITVLSTDLYQFKHCSHENYGILVDKANKIIDFMQIYFKDHIGIDIKDDYTCYKDLLKITIPIALKIDLGVSDDVDVGFFDLDYGEVNPTLKYFVQSLKDEMKQEYNFTLSHRESSLIYDVLFGYFNRIEIPHKKLKLAIIAVNGRLAMQQLKFNLQNHYMEFIESMDTKPLYELETQKDKNYDYYLVSEYGKNMNIKFKPIYYAKESLSEMEYVESLSRVFFNSFYFENILPKLQVVEYKDKKSYFKHLNYLETDFREYEKLKNTDSLTKVFLNMNSSKECIEIHCYWDKDVNTLNYFGVMDSRFNDNDKIKAYFRVSDSLVRNTIKNISNVKELDYTNIIFDKENE